MNRSALPLVWGRRGRVRRCRMPSSSNSAARRFEWVYVQALSVITRSIRTPCAAKNRTVSAMKVTRAVRLLIGPDGDVGDPGRVVDRDMEVVVADRQRVAGSLAEQPVAAAGRDAPEALHVDVEQLARPLSDIADGDPGQPVGMGKAAHAVAPEDAVHGRARMAERGPTMRTPTTPRDGLRIRATWRSVRARGRRRGRAERSSRPAGPSAR